MPENPTARVRKNGPEQLFDGMIRTRGFRPTKRGWPDFLCFDDEAGTFIAVEVKPKMTDPRRLARGGSPFQILKRDQAACMDFLTAHGILCYVSDGVTMEPYDHERHAPDNRRYH